MTREKPIVNHAGKCVFVKCLNCLARECEHCLETLEAGNGWLIFCVCSHGSRQGPKR